MLNLCYSMLNTKIITPPPEIEYDPSYDKIQKLKTSPYGLTLMARYGTWFIILPMFRGTGHVYSNSDKKRDFSLMTLYTQLKPGYKGMNSHIRYVWHANRGNVYCGKFTEFGKRAYNYDVSSVFPKPDVPINEYTDPSNWSIIATGGHYEGLTQPADKLRSRIKYDRPINLLKYGYTFTGFTEEELNNNICFIFDTECIFQGIDLVYRDVIHAVDYDKKWGKNGYHILYEYIP